MAEVGSFLAYLWRLLRGRAASDRPRFVRRLRMDCPHSDKQVEIDLLMGTTGAPELVLRCSAHPSCPPTCDQSCRHCAEAVLAKPSALLMYPRGAGPTDDAD